MGFNTTKWSISGSFGVPQFEETSTCWLRYTRSKWDMWFPCFVEAWHMSETLSVEGSWPELADGHGMGWEVLRPQPVQSSRMVRLIYVDSFNHVTIKHGDWTWFKHPKIEILATKLAGDFKYWSLPSQLSLICGMGRTRLYVPDLKTLCCHCWGCDPHL